MGFMDVLFGRSRIVEDQLREEVTRLDTLVADLNALVSQQSGQIETLQQQNARLHQRLRDGSTSLPDLIPAAEVPEIGECDNSGHERTLADLPAPLE